MARIDTAAWGEFRIGDLFCISKPPVLHSRQVQEDVNGIPYIVRSKFGNGVKCRVRMVESMRPSPAGVVTFGAENSTFFYQPEAFVSGRDMYYLDTRHLSLKACLFLAACLQPIVSKYNYGKGLFPNSLRDETVTLPVNGANEPDWAYMEAFMGKTMDEAEKRLASFLKITSFLPPPTIDIGAWGEFRIGDLFTVSRPAPRSQQSYEDGTVPFVASGNFANGVVRCCAPKDGETIDDGNCITVSPLDGSAFYQPKPFLGRGGAGSAILILRNPSLSEHSGLFIAAVICRALTKQSYAEQLNSSNIRSKSIMLPTGKGGKPDWAYMEAFMGKTMDEAEKRLNALKKVVCR